MTRSTKIISMNRNLVTIVVAAVMAFGVLATGELEAKEDAEIVVGTYQPRKVFSQSKFQQEMRSKMQKAYQDAQKPMKEAQESGDKKKMQQIQSDLQNKQQELINEFRDKLKKVLPDVAEKADVHIIAQGVQYAADDVKKKDVTNDIVKALGGKPKPKMKKKIMPGGAAPGGKKKK